MPKKPASAPAKQPKPAKARKAKSAKAKPAAAAPAAAPAAPKPEEISARAHRIWLDAGKPEGKSLDHWLQAERELSAK